MIESGNATVDSMELLLHGFDFDSNDKDQSNTDCNKDDFMTKIGQSINEEKCPNLTTMRRMTLMTYLIWK